MYVFFSCGLDAQFSYYFTVDRLWTLWIFMLSLTLLDLLFALGVVSTSVGFLLDVLCQMCVASYPRLTPDLIGIYLIILFTIYLRVCVAKQAVLWKELLLFCILNEFINNW